MSSWRALGLLALRHRTSRATWLLLGLVVAVVAFVTTGLLRSIDQAGEDSLTTELERTPAFERALRLNLFDRGSRQEDPLTAIERGASEVFAGAPASLQAVFGEPELVVDLSRFRTVAIDEVEPALPIFLTVRAIAGLDERITVIDGRPGAPTDDETAEELPIVEIGLSEATAAELDVDVGDVLDVLPDPDDLVVRRTSVLPPDVALRVAEIVELTDPTRPEWFGDERLHRPIVNDTAVGADRFAFAFVREAALVDTVFSSAPFNATWLADVEPDAITLASSGAVEDTLQRFIARSATSDTEPGVVFPETLLVDLLGDERAERATVRDLLALALLGLGAQALLTVVLVSEAGERRRTHDAAVARGRGVSRIQLVAMSAVEATIVVAVAAGAGGALANLLVDGASGTGATAGPTLWLTASTVATVVVGAIVRNRAPLGEALSGRPNAPRPPGRIAVATELAIVAVAVAGWTTLRRAGIGGPDRAGLLAVGAPLAVAAVAVLVARRLPPPVARRLAGRRPTAPLSVSLGLRRAEQAGVAATALVASVLLAAAPITIGLALVDAVADVADDEAGGPLADSLRSSAVVIVAAAVVLALVAVVAVARLVVGDGARQRAMLDAMGAPAAVADRAASTEIAVPGAVAAVVAGLLGAVLSVQLADRVDLEVLTGRPDALAPSWWVGAVAGIGLAGACVLAAAVTGRRRPATARLLRTEEGT